jgi:hypothetical protein
MTIQASDLPTHGATLVVDTYNHTTWTVEQREQGGYYAMCDAYDMVASSADEMCSKLNELEAVIVGWE